MLNLSNLKSIEEYYKKFRVDPESVDSSWRSFFEGMELGASEAPQSLERQAKVYHLISFYRACGHLYVENNPLEIGGKRSALDWRGFGLTDNDLNQSFFPDELLKEKSAPLKGIIEKANEIYCNRIGFEYDYCAKDLRDWLKNRLEQSFSYELSHEEKWDILHSLNRSDIFESFLNTKYPGQKRFSIEGSETTIPILQTFIEMGAQKDLKEIVIGMPHRGRLNVLANIVQKPYSVVFHEFGEEYSPFSYEGSGDVKYHKGFSSEISTKDEKTIHVHLSANPSHLESINPIVLGQSYAKQILKGDIEKTKIVPILIHGDASFAGQGIVYESFQFMNLPQYLTGGALHIVINNQIGFTTLPEEARSTTYCSDIAKAFGVPVFHINAEDPDSCIAAAKLAYEIRTKFHIDVILDLICYRKYGHNEGDEPAFTQPLQYKIIRKKPSIREMYRDHLIHQGVVEKQMAKELEEDFKNTLRSALERTQEFMQKTPEPEKMLGTVWSEFMQASEEEIYQSIDTKVEFEKLKQIILKFCEIPKDFHIHPKLGKWLHQRVELLQKDPKEQTVDWSLAEMLAFGSLICEKTPLRIVGQDTKRGTFNQRHIVWMDQTTAKQWYPLNHLSEDQAECEIVNTPLSEYAALGFEYGYSLSYPKALVLWEAQFGDFTNAAQVMIDQYITTAEKKWQRCSSLVLLLPHGYEGQGPEHSSARMERFLQLAADNNIQVVNCTMPVQYFHLLRRQAIRKLKKPLVVFTPKSLLRHPLCKSSLKEFSMGSFEEVLDDFQDLREAKRLLICSGKVFYDLIKEREKRKNTQIAIIRLEQLYPLIEEKIKKILEKYQNMQECFWVQEEPQNMGAYEYIRYPLQVLLKKGINLQYVGRIRSASPAVGSHKVHKKESETFLSQAFD